MLSTTAVAVAGTPEGTVTVWMPRASPGPHRLDGATSESTRRVGATATNPVGPETGLADRQPRNPAGEPRPTFAAVAHRVCGPGPGARSSSKPSLLPRSRRVWLAVAVPTA